MHISYIVVNVMIEYVESRKHMVNVISYRYNDVMIPSRLYNTSHWCCGTHDRIHVGNSMRFTLESC